MVSARSKRCHKAAAGGKGGGRMVDRARFCPNVAQMKRAHGFCAAHALESC
ncbi:hypothetical protein [Azospirillum largimobile]